VICLLVDKDFYALAIEERRGAQKGVSSAAPPRFRLLKLNPATGLALREAQHYGRTEKKAFRSLKLKGDAASELIAVKHCVAFWFCGLGLLCLSHPSCASVNAVTFGTGRKLFDECDFFRERFEALSGLSFPLSGVLNY
jgi:hypothetical protein